MVTHMVYYKNISTNNTYVDTYSNFKEIRNKFGYDNYILITEKFCKSKKESIKFKKSILSK